MIFKVNEESSLFVGVYTRQIKATCTFCFISNLGNVAIVFII